MSEVARSLSNELAEAVERGGSSVVRVEGGRYPGSGIVWSADGVVAAASHSVEQDEGLEVGLPDGRTVGAKLIGRDPTTDVAALRVEASSLALPAWADAAGAKVGHLVLALSRPGRNVRATLGIVSVRAEAWRTPAGGRLDHYVQTDVGRHPGLSGSLLVAAGGGAIGMNTAGLLRGATLALTAPTLTRVLESLLAHGQVRRGFLGVSTYPVRLPAAAEKDAGQATGLMLVSVEPGGPAERGGLRLGDALLTFDGHALRHPADLLGLLEPERVGTEVAVTALRAGEIVTKRVVIGTRAAS